MVALHARRARRSPAALADAASAEALYPALLPPAHNLAQSGFAGCAGSVERVLGRLAAALDRPERPRDISTPPSLVTKLGARALTARTRCDLGEILLTGAADARARAASLLADADRRRPRTWHGRRGREGQPRSRRLPAGSLNAMPHRGVPRVREHLRK